MLLSGHFPELIYDYGALDQSLPFAELRRRSLINERARAADGAPDFSRRIREDLPARSVAAERKLVRVEAARRRLEQAQ